MKTRCPVSVLVLIAFFTLAGPSRADYVLPEVDERYILVLDLWEFESPADSGALVPEGPPGKESGADPALAALEEGRENTWRIDLFWLADRIDSDSICTGDHVKSMREYLARVAREGAGKRLVVEIVSAEGSKGLFVAGLWILDPETAYDRATRHGSGLLGLEASAVADLGSAEAYVARLEEISEASWKRMASR